LSISELAIKDLSGRLIQAQKPENKNSGQLDLSNLAAGTYLLTIISDDGRILTRKITRE
jgi:hypothetical protein